ncbi:efflux RND transporter permease subunit [Acidaminobacter hydrogenoformans]|uniref:Multidrug efflux pump subunit AcrB n=1 Tax=Acidaminobacter hydrogenoformans DSM 2784 TaxID=1120920 RepID=A0A1G5RYM6_9FIRM|nr:efflux RND transporter permease subunit [Acidaminobacter hydrogenoformans]SCZ79037.1 Multidrug efflux pump subunit AcrB [Acidaminobacter hydrogenoformans DSM 2784]
MSFGKFSVEKRHVVLSLVIGIILFGVYSFLTMNTQLSPDTNAPTATVMTAYPGASASDVVTEVAAPLEQAFAKLEGITDIESTSQDNLAMLRLTFDYATDIDEATIAIQNALSRARESLPEGIKEPQVMKFSASDMPVMTIGLSSTSLDMAALRRVAEESLLTRFQLTEGVASADLLGGYELQALVSLNEDRLRAYRLTEGQVVEAVSRAYLKTPGGSILHEGSELLVRVDANVSSAEALGQLEIPLADGNGIRLEDVAAVSLTTGARESSYRLNGEEMLAVTITKKTGENTIKVIERVEDEMARMAADYPNLSLHVAYDDAEFTEQMVSNMTTSIALAILFTIVVIVLFIVNISRSLVIAVSMPLVFLITLSLMRLFGMDLDLVTLSALILSIGFVVDGAIVVVENISSHAGKGKSIERAAMDGTNEIAMPSIAGATTTLIVLVPLLFIQGFVGEMFRPLSMTLIFAISASLFVALVMIPQLSVLMAPFEFKKTEGFLKKVTDPFNRWMDKLLEGYIHVFKKALYHKKLTFLLLIVGLGLSAGFLRMNGMEMLPKFDSGVTYITIEMTPGTTLEKTEATLGQIESYLAGESSVATFDTRLGYEEGSVQMGDFGMMGTDQGMITVSLTSRLEREESIWAFQVRLREKIDTLPGINRYVVKEKGGTAVSGATAPVAVKLSGDDLAVLYHLASQMEEKLETIPGITNLYKSYNDGYSQMSVRFDQTKLQALRLTSQSVSSQLYLALEGMEANTMTLDSGLTLGVQVENRLSGTQSLEQLMNTEIMTPLGASVRLKEIAEVTQEPRSNLIESENMRYTVEVLGYIQDRTFSHVMTDVDAQIETMVVPMGYEVELAGEQKTLTDSMGDMVFLISLAIFFVYLLLVPQFKSFLHPLTIMMAIPLVVIGIAPALGLTGKVISMPVLLGIILLAGTVVNNSILLVDAINDHRSKGFEMREAIELAIRARFRPIMMTALSDVVGMMPLAMQLALGSERFSPLAVTVIGGITAATGLTIVVIPLIYVTLENLFVKEDRFIAEIRPEAAEAAKA